MINLDNFLCDLYEFRQPYVLRSPFLPRFEIILGKTFAEAIAIAAEQSPQFRGGTAIKPPKMDEKFSFFGMQGVVDYDLRPHDIAALFADGRLCEVMQLATYREREDKMAKKEMPKKPAPKKPAKKASKK